MYLFYLDKNNKHIATLKTMIKRLTEGNNVISYHARQKGCTRKFQTYARVHPDVNYKKGNTRHIK